MQSADRIEFVRILEGLAAMKPGKGLTPEALSLWWGAMQAWSLDEFRQAAQHLAISVEFMPNPFHFEQLRKAGRPTAGECWARALQCARNGRRSSGNALIDRAVQAIGGYTAIGMSEVDKTHFLEKRFCEHFEDLQDAEDVRESVPQIAHQGAARLASTSPSSAAQLLPSLRRGNP